MSELRAGPATSAMGLGSGLPTPAGALPNPGAMAVPSIGVMGMTPTAPQQAPLPQGGAPRPDLAGTLHVLPQYSALGATRPFGPGEYVMNSNGGWSSEYSVTVEDPRQPGRYMVVPSLWLMNGKPMLLSEDQAAETAAKSGLVFPTFGNEQSAEAFSVQREAKWQKVPVGRSDLQPPLWRKGP